MFIQVFVVLLLAFGTAFVSIYRFDIHMFATFPKALMFSFESAFIPDLADQDQLKDNTVAFVVFWVWFILVTVVLLNILIAMMTSTYDDLKL